MRTILFLLFMPISMFAQHTKPPLYIYPQHTKPPLQIDTNKNGKEQMSYENLNDNAIKDEELVSSTGIDKKLEGALNLNVFEYYDLDEIYNTELKKQNYKETPDYKQKLTSLKSIKSQFEATNLYIDLSKQEEFSIYDYDLNKQGFSIRIGYMLAQYEVNFFGCYEIKSLPAKFVLSSGYSPITNSQKLYDRIIFIPIRKDLGAKIEERRSQISCFLVCKPIGLKQNKSILGLNMFQNSISTNNVRLILIDKETNEIYFDKNYLIGKK